MLAELGVGKHASFSNTTVCLAGSLFQDENLLGLGLYLKTYVYFGSQSSMAREPLQLACEADPRDSPASVLPLPLWELFHLISS